ncbi:hypothetical protein [Paraburkholderia sp. 40]|uniref:hypothetical protein n=1 Tax=Paraburkholderia sp. 40 TaxID=2991059 RepID=UPI003D25BCCF
MPYSKGFSHDTPNGSFGGRIDIVLNAVEAHPRSWTPGVRFHLDYYNFGKVRWSSKNQQDAADFTNFGLVASYNSSTQSCNDNNCGSFRRFDSSVGIQAIAPTVEPYSDLGGCRQLGVKT